MDLSLVIVNWNTRELLLRLLGQLADPPGDAPRTEVLVVDNHSTDGSVAAARQEFPSAVVLPQECNGGFAYGVNRGIERARGRIVMLVNTDVELDWNAVGALVRYADDHPSAGVVGPRITDERGVAQVSHWHGPGLAAHFMDAIFLGRLWRRGATSGATDTATDCVSGCVFAIRREALEAVPDFDQGYFMYFEEIDYCERVRKAGFEVRFTPGATMVHHGGLSSAQARTKTFLAFRRSCLRFHARNRGRITAELVRASLVLASALRLLPLLVTSPAKARCHWRALGMLLHPAAVARARDWANDHLLPGTTAAAAADGSPLSPTAEPVPNRSAITPTVKL